MVDVSAFGYEGGEEFNDEQLLSMFMDVEGLNSLHGAAGPGHGDGALRKRLLGCRDPDFLWLDGVRWCRISRML